MRLVCGLMLTAWLLRADYKEVRRVSSSGYESVRTEYKQGNKIREELRESRGPQVFISRSPQGPRYYLDLETRQYMVEEEYHPGPLATLASWISHPPRTRESGKTVNIYYDVLDTGERGTAFGHETRHLISYERVVSEPGACQSSRESKKDGWYIPETAKARQTHGFLMVGDVRGFCHDRLIFHGRQSLGFAVRQTTDHSEEEVLEMSDGPLDSSLFEPPRDFRRVTALRRHRVSSWGERMQQDWNQLARAFESWFE